MEENYNEEIQEQREVRPFEEVRTEDFDVQPIEEEARPARLPRKENHLVAGIVLTALFSVFGLPTLINACKSLMRWRRGNYDAALLSARKARRWIAPAIIFGVIVTIAYIVFYIWWFQSVYDLSLIPETPQKMYY